MLYEQPHWPCQGCGGSLAFEAERCACGGRTPRYAPQRAAAEVTREEADRCLASVGDPLAAARVLRRAYPGHVARPPCR